MSLLSLSVEGGTLLESAGPGVWVGTPVPTDCCTGDGCPSEVNAAPCQPIAHTVQNLPPQCASLLDTFSVSVVTPLTLSVQNT